MLIHIELTSVTLSEILDGHEGKVFTCDIICELTGKSILSAKIAAKKLLLTEH